MPLRGLRVAFLIFFDGSDGKVVVEAERKWNFHDLILHMESNGRKGVAELDPQCLNLYLIFVAAGHLPLGFDLN